MKKNQHQNQKLSNREKAINNLTFEPIAIVSMAFKFPEDCADEHSFWSGLKTRHDFVTQVPSDRWAVDELQHNKRSEPGRSVTFSAGVLSGLDQFDAEFFGISPREAAMVDPQHRLLLELSWQAMENAGYLPSQLAGTNCAVYVGISGLDYGTRMLDDCSLISSHTMTGNTLSVAANRLSYFFDLRGPSLAVDTACSSSLVALHHACMSLQTGDASMALVGGVNMLLHPYPFIGFTKASMLSKNGRCKVFDASADGYVRSEGGAVFILKPLKTALQDGDDIQAVIRSTGVNADGGRKTGITIPSAEGQADLMRSVIAKSGLSSNEVDFVEAHGTGTIVGDPIEAHAIGEVYGQGKSTPLPIGSVKANVGHLESASGMAGLVKTVLALKNRALPPALHLTKPNPYIDFSKLNLELVTDYKSISSENNKPLIAGINSFGFGGANAHMLLQEFKAKPARKAQSTSSKVSQDSLAPLFLSARSEAALRAQAEQYHDFLKQKSAPEFYDVAHSVVNYRDNMEKGLALKSSSFESLLESLLAFSQGEFPADVVLGDALKTDGQIAFVYSGNGAQWAGMCKPLMTQSPRFVEILNQVDAVLKPIAGFSVIDELMVDKTASRLEDTVVAQPLLFAIQVAVTLLLKEQGIEPKAVTGHSVGEVAAAWAAGVFDLKQATQLICARSAAQALTQGAGRMAAASVSEAEMMAILAEYDNELDIEIAGINSPQNITLSGKLADLKVIQKRLKAVGTFFKLLDIDYAFHSRHMDAIHDTLKKSLVDLRPSPTKNMTFVSAITGGVVKGVQLNADYWWKNVRQPVQFSSAITSLVNLGCNVFVEVGPHAILQRYLTECLSASDVEHRILPTLVKDAHHGLSQIEAAALRTHIAVGKQRNAPYFKAEWQRVRLPNYPWQRERYWYAKTSEGEGLLERRRSHPILGWRVNETDTIWENTVDTETLPWLADHQVAGAVVFPGSAYVEMALAAAKEWLGEEQFSFEELDIISPIVFDEDHARTLRFVLNQRDGGFQILSRQRLSADEFSLHAAGRILEATKTQRPQQIGALANPVITIDKKTHYALTARLGLDYGAAFQGLRAIRINHDCLEADVRLPKLVDADTQYIIHPAMLDLCFQSLVDFFHEHIQNNQGIAFLPTKVSKLNYYSDAKPVKFRARLKRFSLRAVLADFELLDKSGNLVAIAADCRFRSAPLMSRKENAIDQWETVPRLRPHPFDTMTSHFPAINALLPILDKAMVSQDAQRQTWFKETLPLLEALTVSYIFEAFQAVALEKKDKLSKLLNDKPSSFLLWLASVLIRENLLINNKGKWQVVVDTEVPKSKDIWQYIQGSVPTCSSQLLLMGRIGSRLPALMTGVLDEKDYLAVLAKSTSTEALYDSDPAYVGILNAIENTILALATHVPTGRRLRVLEIVSGPSLLPRRLLNKFDEDRLDYVVAVPEEAIAEHLQADYHDFSNLIVATVDLTDGKLTADKPLPELFDIIVMRHALHRFAYPHGAIKQIAQRLTQGGVTLIAERYPDVSADLIGGVDPSWWYVEDTVSDDGLTKVESALLTPEAWMQALSEEGFDEVEHFAEASATGLAQGAYLVLAKRLEARTNEAISLDSKAWLLLADDASSAVANQLKARLELQSQVVTIANAIPENEAHIDHIVSLLGWNKTAEDAVDVVSNVMQQIQHIVESVNKPANFWLLTQGGALTTNTSSNKGANPVQAALWGLGRVVMNEYAMLNCKLIDVASDLADEEMVHRLANELLHPDGANELMLSGEGRYSLLTQTHGTQSDKEASNDERYHLDFLTAGQLRNLVWLPTLEKPLLANQVEVKTKAAGLNFRDIMYLMGLLPDEAVEKGFAGASLGLEFSGVITRVGADVKDYHPGESVMGFGSSCFASHVVTSAEAVAPMPESWTFEAAATVPTTFFTVYYALKHLADLQPGEKVLIHGAAGGVGIAAVQLAQHLGAEIFATAGSDEKRDFVRLLGADHVFDSRSFDFADDIAAATGGEGVDVILNSLAGEAIRRNLSVLKPFGRFLELGKRDFFENTPVGLRPFKDNISYFGIDADQLLVNRPALANRLFYEVMALFHEGAFTPLPHRVFDVERIIDAFRLMQQARHIGKVVVSLDGARPKIKQQKETLELIKLDKNSTWLITGGLSGFGLESAKWLLKRGAKNLVLLSRRGMKTPGAKAVVAELTAAGAKVLALSCDITDATKLAEVIKQVQATMPPLKGVLHAAMVIDDQLISKLDENSVSSVIQPKLLGAWHLHTLTQHLPLDYFVLYSSITTYIGNPGQANYVAANAGLEGLAELRRSNGLPAQCIGWGPIADAGYLTRNTAVKDSLGQRMGKEPMLAHEALQQLDDVLRNKNALHAIANFDWRILSKILPSASGVRFDQLNAELLGVGNMDDNFDFQAIIAGKDRQEVEKVVTEMIVHEVSVILCISVERIHPRRSLHDLGMDSLMAVELAMGLERRFGIQLPVMMLNESPNTEKVALRIVDKVFGDDGADGQEHMPNLLVKDLARQHGEEISEQEVEHAMEDVRKLAEERVR